MEEIDAALCFTAAQGWHLQPSHPLLMAVKRYPKPRWRYDPVRTRQSNLDAGYSAEHVNRILEMLSVEENHAELLRRQPGLLRTRAQLAPAGAEDPGRLARVLE